jgi:tetratricopeptide (TPR) repeat protein
MMRDRSKRKPGRSTVVVTYVLLGIWLVLISFGVVSAMGPDWLEGLSSRGIGVESKAAKNAGDTLLRQGEHERAIALYQYALRVDPEYVGAMTNLANAYRLHGEPELGEALLRDALRERRGQQGVIAFNLAGLLEERGDREEALRYYRMAIDSSARQDLVFEKIGTLLFDEGAYDEALDAFEKTLEIRTDPATSYRTMLRRSLAAFEGDSTNLAVIEAQLGREWSAADLAPYDLELILEAQHVDDEIARTHTCLGIIHGRMGRAEKAVAHLEKALEIAPDDKHALTHLREQRRLLDGGGRE